MLCWLCVSCAHHLESGMETEGRDEAGTLKYGKKRINFSSASSRVRHNPPLGGGGGGAAGSDFCKSPQRVIGVASFQGIEIWKSTKKNPIRGWDGWIWWPSKPRERFRDFGLCLLYLASRGGLMLLADVPHTVSDKNKNKNKQKNNTHKNRMLIPGETPQSSVPIWILLDAWWEIKPFPPSFFTSPLNTTLTWIQIHMNSHCLVDDSFLTIHYPLLSLSLFTHTHI